MNAKELRDLFASGRAYVACDGERLIDEATAREADAIAARALGLLAAAEANDGTSPETNRLSDEISRRTFAQNIIKAADVLDALDLSRTFEQRCNALAARVAELECGEPVAWIEHHKGGDNLTWDRVDHPGFPATPLYAARSK